METQNTTPITNANSTAPVIMMQSPNTIYTPIAIVLAGVLIAGGLFFGLSHQGTAAPATGGVAAKPSVNVKDVKTAGNPFIGPADAKVVLAFWSDFQCPFCKAVETGGVPQIKTTAAIPEVIKNYVDTGKVKIVFKDFPFLGNDSMTAAEYARSIWALYPTQYYPWRVAMYKAQDEEGDQGFGNALSIDALIKKSFPAIDDAKVKADLVAHKDAYDTAIDADRAEGGAFGVSGTPGFVTGTTLIEGAQQFAAFKAAIDPQLK
jgi:protein-disulfide isomerase